MREIKFAGEFTYRIWCSADKKMLYTYDDVESFAKANGETVEDVLNCTFSDTGANRSTGLLDKNGKEIYEGDIVKPVQTKGMRWKIGKIEYQRGEFVIVPKGETRSFKTLTEAGWLKIEIIGNIYENPNLLK